MSEETPDSIDVKLDLVLRNQKVLDTKLDLILRHQRIESWEDRQVG